jgi:hypothetical protein
MNSTLIMRASRRAHLHACMDIFSHQNAVEIEDLDTCNHGMQVEG